MWTIKYGSHWIHGYCDKPDCRIQHGETFKGTHVKSLLAAKRRIRKLDGLQREKQV